MGIRKTDGSTPNLTKCVGCGLEIPEALSLETKAGRYGPQCLGVAFDKLFTDHNACIELLAKGAAEIDRLKQEANQFKSERN